MFEDSRGSRWLLLLLACLMCASLAAGCAALPTEPTNSERVGSAVGVGEGTEAGTWRAWAYRTKANATCIEVAGTRGGGYRCSETIGGLKLPGIIRTDGGTFVLGASGDAKAARAQLTATDGSQVTAPLVDAAPVAPGWRVYVLALQDSSPRGQVQIIDSTGTEIESDAVGS